MIVLVTRKASAPLCSLVKNHLKPTKHEHVPHRPEEPLPDAVLRVVFAISVTTEPNKLTLKPKFLIHLWDCTELTSPSSSSPLAVFAQVHFQALAHRQSPSPVEPPGESSWWIDEFSETEIILHVCEVVKKFGMSNISSTEWYMPFAAQLMFGPMTGGIVN